MGRPSLRTALERAMPWMRRLPEHVMRTLVAKLTTLADKKRDNASRWFYGLPPTRL